jgi:hypothetical protein
MTTFKGSGFYHVGATATNRQVTFQIKAQAGLSNCFLFLKGNNAFHPWVGQISAPTTNQKIAQYRVDYIVRALTIYAIPVAVKIVDAAYTNETGNAVQITFETLVSSVFANENDIADTLGMADRAVKTKDGLQTLATDLLAVASLDGGGTFLYAVNAALADGTASTAAAITSLTVDAV